MKIDKKMNLVIPIIEEYHDKDGVKQERTVCYVHSSPISADVFDAYFLVIAKTYAQIITEGLGFVGGPRIADKLLRKTAQDLGVWEGQNGVQAGLMNQLYRLTNVIHVGERGWQSTPYEIARKNVLTPADASEVESAIVFFGVSSQMFRKSQVEDLVGGAMKLWGAQITSLNSTEYLNTLPALTVPVSIGVKGAA